MTITKDSHFSKAVLDMLPFADFVPDIIHCNDWQTGPYRCFESRLIKITYLKTLKQSIQYTTFEVPGRISDPSSMEMLDLPWYLYQQYG